MKHRNKKSLGRLHRKVLLIAPLMSMAIYMLGNGVLTTLTTLQLHAFKTSAWMIGLVSAFYFVGMMLGAYLPRRFIIRVGHIRSYATFASMTAVCILWQSATEAAWLWLFLRAVCGFCITATFLVTEGWCLHNSHRKNRGSILALYMFLYYLAQSTSQLFLHLPNGMVMQVFVITALLSSLSIIPVCMTHFPTPKLEAAKIPSPFSFIKQVPLGIFAALVAGLILGNVYTILPLAFQSLHFHLSRIATLMFIVILGGTLLQYPIGKISDYTDRRKVLLSVALACVGFSLLIMLLQDFWLGTLASVFLFGGMTFVIYPLSISHSTDFIKKSSIVGLLAALSFSFGVGSSIGPVLGIGMEHAFGAWGIFIFMAFVSLLLALYAWYRLGKRPDVKESKKVAFVPVAREVTDGSEQVLQEQVTANK